MELNIKILKFNDFTTRTHDYKGKLNWFSMPVDLLSHPDFFNINGDEFKAFIWVVGVAVKVKKNQVRMNIDHIAHFLRISKNDIISCLHKLEGKQLLTDGLATARPDCGHEAAIHYITLHNITEQNTYAQISKTEDQTKQVAQKQVLSDSVIESIYKEYPRKVGKAKGLAKLKSQLKTQTDLELCVRALAKFKKYHIDKGTLGEYIPHFSTWVSSWKDWLDEDVGAIDPRIKTGDENKIKSITEILADERLR